MTEIKEDKKNYKTCLKEERENHERQEKQLTELMQGLVVVAQQEKMKHEILMQEQEVQHAKEIEEIWEGNADQAKLRKEDYKKMMAKILTPKENQQENSKKQQEHHQTMTKSLETNKEETMDAEEHKVALI